MSQPRTRSRARTAGIVALLVFAFASTVVGVCMVAYAESTRFVRIGILVGAWGFLLGAFAIRSTGVMSSARASLGMAEPVQPGQDIALRRAGEVELESDAAARREYELQLELMLRRQMEQVLREQVAELRRDIAGLRGEVLEAVDGRLRLERVETTRIIGSDLAALHGELQRLHVERGSITRDNAPIPISSAGPRSELWTPTTVTTTSTAAGAVPAFNLAELSVEPERVEAPIVTPPAAPVPAQASAPKPAPKVVTAPLSAPARKIPVPAPPPAKTPVPVARHGTGAPQVNPNPPANERKPEFDRDPFAGLPRLSAFKPATTRPAETAPAAPEANQPYVGRRRQSGEQR